jgi:cytoskeleton protein RodZ
MGSFGERLQREREMRGITLEEIADSTKIGTRSLRALEQEDFDKLPGGIFNKGFVRAYARYLGIDEEQAVTDFLAAAGESEPQLPNPSPTEKLTAYRSGSRGWAAALALVVLAAGGYAAWRLNLWPLAGYTARQTAPPVQPPAATAPPSSSAGAGTRPAEPASTVASPTAATPEPGLASGQNPAAAGQGFVLLVRAKEDSWVSITADGQVVMEGKLARSQSKEVRATKSVVLKLGNAAGVEVSHNNTLLPPLGRVNEVKTVVFTPDGLQP